MTHAHTHALVLADVFALDPRAAEGVAALADAGVGGAAGGWR